MIKFIEKKPWEDKDPFIGETYVPVFMVKGGVEYFVINRVAKATGDSLYAAQANERLNSVKTMLKSNGGLYAKFYGLYDDPEAMLTEMEQRGHTFTQPDDIFTDCHDDKRYGAGFTDFSGNRNEVSAAFHYRIFDKTYADKLKKAAQPIVERSQKDEI